MTTCEPVVMYKDTKGIAWNTCEECEKANRKYRQEEALKKVSEYFVKNSDAHELIYITDYYSSSYPRQDLNKTLTRRSEQFLSNPKNMKALLKAVEIYYEELGADL